jgi:RNA polymerase sigma-70 factor (ECF subfamily)
VTPDGGSAPDPAAVRPADRRETDAPGPGAKDGPGPGAKDVPGPVAADAPGPGAKDGPGPGAKDVPGPAETEASLLARARAGDVAAFERLSGAYADRLFMLLVRLLGDRDEAGDVAQEVMLRAWRGIASFRGQSSYFTWLYRIAVNEANRALEKRARRPAGVPIGAGELDLPAPAELDPSRQAESRELRRALGRALAGLPPPLRTAIVLRDVEGLSTQEAAEIAGIGQAAFKSRLHQARLRVRAALGDEMLVAAGG